MVTTAPIQTGSCGPAGESRRPRPRGFGRPERLAFPLESLASVGPSLARKLRLLGLVSVADLLYRRPRRYEAVAAEVAIADLFAGEEVAIAGEIGELRLRRPRRGLTIVTARLADGSGSVPVSWFNQPWLEDQLRPGTEVRLRGRLGPRGFEVRSFDTGEARATADYAPVYGASEQVSSNRLRELVRGALARHACDVLDPLPAELDLPLKRDAVFALHFPRRPRRGRARAGAARARRADRRPAARGRPLRTATPRWEGRSRRPACSRPATARRSPSR